MLNIGCGPVFHPDWLNLDVEPVDAAVQRFDARGPLPFEDASVDVIYHSHLLEHLGPVEADEFVLECLRILRPGGVMRVVVPDLEGIARAYLSALDEARKGEDETLYEWTRLELIDQLVREKSGGEMAEYLKRLDPGRARLVRTRAGTEIDGYIDAASRKGALHRVTFGKIARRLRFVLAQTSVGLIGGMRMVEALKCGVFRQRGEVHRVMYDELALARLLGQAGFCSIARVTAFTSSMPDFGRYSLDVRHGEIRKPDSLFMEARKP
jgi:SAM-dependent methyltransferase